MRYSKSGNIGNFHDSTTCVYFLQRGRGKKSAIKIGCTGDLVQRIQSLTVRGGPWQLLGYMPGDNRVESHLHERFKRFRLPGAAGKGDWFRSVPLLARFAKASVNFRVAKQHLAARSGIRRDVGISVNDVARIAGIPSTLVSGWESSIHDVEVLERIYIALQHLLDVSRRRKSLGRLNAIEAARTKGRL